MQKRSCDRVKQLVARILLATVGVSAFAWVSAGRVATPAATVRGDLPVTWYAGGPTCSEEPRLRVHAYTVDFYILRQPACTNYEKPFLYLLIGGRRALLLDTGAGGLNVALTVDSLLNAWRLQHGGSPAELVVAHSHGHGDHVAGDSQFVNRAGVTLVGRDTASVHAFFGVQHWPDDIVPLDLGGRTIDVIPIPGHQAASVAYYDRRTGVLLTGDTFYPGRLYVRDTAAFVRSISRLVQFSATHPIAHLLGTHIENTSEPGIDYPVGTVDQPREHVLQLTRPDLLRLDSALATMRGNLRRTVLPNYTIWPVTP
jgi:hydroxyacylglutathione hydrolase